MSPPHLTPHTNELLPLIIGVTGHRDLRDEDIEGLKSAVRGLLREVREKHPHTPLVLLSPLGEGSDRLVANVALEEGAQLFVPLPLPQDIYEESFDSKESRAEFASLLAKATSVFTLPWIDPNHEGQNAPVPGTATNAQVVGQYAAMGAYIARHSHIFLALWDGDETITNERTGGTAQIVRFRLYSAPPPYGPVLSPLERSGYGAVHHIVTPRKSHPPLKGEPYSCQILPSPDSAEDFDRIEGFNEDVLEFKDSLKKNAEQNAQWLIASDKPVTPAPPMPNLDNLQHALGVYGWSDALSTHFSKKMSLAVKRIFLLVFFAAGSFNLFHSLPHADHGGGHDAPASSSTALAAEAPAHGVAPATGEHAPAAESHAPAPAAGAHAPAAESHKPAAESHSAPEESHAPADVAHAPADTTHAPADTSHAPAASSHAPADTSHAPAAESHTPADASHAPADTSHAPASGDHGTSSADHGTSGGGHGDAGHGSPSLWSLLPWFLWLYLILVVLNVQVHQRAEKQELQNKYQDYRALAEGLRVQIYWRLMGLHDDVSDHYLAKQRGELNWIRNAIKSCNVMSDAQTKQKYNDEGDRLSLVVRQWVYEQRNYYVRKAHREQEELEKQEKIINQFLIGSVCLAILLALSLSIPSFVPALNPIKHFVEQPYPHAFIMITIVMMAVIAALLHAYNEQLAHSEHAKRYGRMGILFNEAHKELESQLAAGHYHKMHSLLHELGREALAENGDWVLLHRERPLEVPHAG